MAGSSRIWLDCPCSVPVDKVAGVSRISDNLKKLTIDRREGHDSNHTLGLQKCLHPLTSGQISNTFGNACYALVRPGSSKQGTNLPEAYAETNPQSGLSSSALSHSQPNTETPSK